MQNEADAEDVQVAFVTRKAEESEEYHSSLQMELQTSYKRKEIVMSNTLAWEGMSWCKVIGLEINKFFTHSRGKAKMSSATFIGKSDVLIKGLQGMVCRQNRRPKALM